MHLLSTIILVHRTGQMSVQSQTSQSTKSIADVSDVLCFLVNIFFFIQSENILFRPEIESSFKQTYNVQTMTNRASRTKKKVLWHQWFVGYPDRQFLLRTGNKYSYKHAKKRPSIMSVLFDCSNYVSISAKAERLVQKHVSRLLSENHCTACLRFLSAQLSHNWTQSWDKNEAPD